MKHIYLIAGCLALAGCKTGTTAVSTPSEIADSTVIDEKGEIAVESAYQAASQAGMTLVNSGVLDKGKFKAADAVAYQAVLGARQAYAAGNSTDYITALAKAQGAVSTLSALVKG